MKEQIEQMKEGLSTGAIAAERGSVNSNIALFESNINVSQSSGKAQKKKTAKICRPEDTAYFSEEKKGDKRMDDSDTNSNQRNSVKDLIMRFNTNIMEDSQQEERSAKTTKAGAGRRTLNDHVSLGLDFIASANNASSTQLN